nr:MAG TPA: SfsA N-terminal OB domain [Caudoviricetes sp.]
MNNVQQQKPMVTRYNKKTAKKFSGTTCSCKNPGRISDFQHSNTT